MIEREFIIQKTRERAIAQYLLSKLDKNFISSIKLKKIPMGEKIIIDTSKPSLVVGSKGANIKSLTKDLKQEFNLENPQIEINEIKNPYLDAKLVGQKIASSLEKFGISRFKGVGHKMMENVIKSGARGVEIVVSGKVPSSRAKSWRFYQGYLKKCGDVAISGVDTAHASALLKTGIVGIKVSIMPPDLQLPDHINIIDEAQAVVGTQAAPATVKEEKKEKEKKSRKRPAAHKSDGKAKKAAAKKQDTKEETEHGAAQQETAVAAPTAAPAADAHPKEEKLGAATVIEDDTQAVMVGAEDSAEERHESS